MREIFVQSMIHSWGPSIRSAATTLVAGCPCSTSESSTSGRHYDGRVFCGIQYGYQSIEYSEPVAALTSAKGTLLIRPPRHRLLVLRDSLRVHSHDRKDITTMLVKRCDNREFGTRTAGTHCRSRLLASQTEDHPGKAEA